MFLVRLLVLPLCSFHAPSLSKPFARMANKLIQVMLHLLALNQLEQRLHTPPLKCLFLLLDHLPLDFPVHMQRRGTEVCIPYLIILIPHPRKEKKTYAGSKTLPASIKEKETHWPEVP